MAPRRTKKKILNQGKPKLNAKKVKGANPQLTWNGFHHRLLSSPQVILAKDDKSVLKALQNMTIFSPISENAVQNHKNLISQPKSQCERVCSICSINFIGGSTPPTATFIISMQKFNDLVFTQDFRHPKPDLKGHERFSTCSNCSPIVTKVGRILNQIKELGEKLTDILVCVRMAIKLKQDSDEGLIEDIISERDARVDVENEYPNYFLPPGTSDSEFQEDMDEEEDIKPFILDLDDDPLDLDLLIENDHDNDETSTNKVVENHENLPSGGEIPSKLATAEAKTSNKVYRKRPGPKSKTRIITTEPAKNEDESEEPIPKKRKSRLKAEELLRKSLLALDEESQDGNNCSTTNAPEGEGNAKVELDEDDDPSSNDDDLKADDAEEDESGDHDAANNKSVGKNNIFPRRKSKSRTWDLPCTCPTCGKPFINRKSLIPHIQSVHEGLRRFKCPVVTCGKSFFRKCNLVQHSARPHPENGPPITWQDTTDCPICGRTYSTRGGLTLHLKLVHDGMRPFKCQHEGCNKTFSRRREYDYHILRHEGLQKHLCSVCGKDFSHSRTLNTHLRDVHDQHPTQNRKTYACTFPGCQKVVTKKTNFNRHLETHKPPEERTTCPTCSQTFPTLQMKEEHQRSVHQGKSNFECDICKKSFPRQISLNVHYKTHTTDTPFKCDKCGQNFKYKGSYLSHSKTVCGTDEDEMERIRMAKKVAQMKHRKKEKKISCDKCDNKFVNVIRLQDHLRRVHNVVIESSARITPSQIQSNISLENQIAVSIAEPVHEEPA